MGGYISGGGGVMPPEISTGMAHNVVAAFKRLALGYKAVNSSVKAADSSDEDRKPNSSLQKPADTPGPQPGISEAAAVTGNETATITPAGPAMQRDIVLCSAAVLDIPLSVHLTGWPDYQPPSVQQQRDAALEVAVPALVLEALGVAIGDLIQVVPLVCHASLAIISLHGVQSAHPADQYGCFHRRNSTLLILVYAERTTPPAIHESLDRSRNDQWECWSKFRAKVIASLFAQVWAPGTSRAAHIARAASSPSSIDSVAAHRSSNASRNSSLCTSDQTHSSAQTTEDPLDGAAGTISSGSSNRTIATGATVCLSPQLASNLGLGCHLQPLLWAAEIHPQQRDVEIVALQAFAGPSQHRSSVSMAVPGRPAICVPAATAISITTVAAPEATLLPSEENPVQDQASMMPGSEGTQQGAALPSLHAGDGSEAHDEAVLDAYQAAIVRFFQTQPRLLCCGDVFCLPVQMTASLEGALATLHGSSTGGACKPVHFQVIKLSPGASPACRHVSRRRCSKHEHEMLLQISMFGWVLSKKQWSFSRCGNMTV